MIQKFADWLVFSVFGLSVDTSLGVAVNFFFYDTIKIIILLFVISFVGINAVVEMLAATVSVGAVCKLSDNPQTVRTSILCGSIVWSCYTFLFLLVGAVVYRLCKRRDTFGRYIHVSNILAFGKRSSRSNVLG